MEQGLRQMFRSMDRRTKPGVKGRRFVEYLLENSHKFAPAAAGLHRHLQGFVACYCHNSADGVSDP